MFCPLARAKYPFFFSVSSSWTKYVENAEAKHCLHANGFLKKYFIIFLIICKFIYFAVVLLMFKVSKQFQQKPDSFSGFHLNFNAYVSWNRLCSPNTNVHLNSNMLELLNIKIVFTTTYLKECLICLLMIWRWSTLHLWFPCYWSLKRNSRKSRKVSWFPRKI